MDILTEDEIKLGKAIHEAVAANEKQLKNEFYYNQLPVFGFCIFLVSSLVFVVIGKYMNIKHTNILLAILAGFTIISCSLSFYLIHKNNELESEYHYLSSRIEEQSEVVEASTGGIDLSGLENKISTVETDVEKLKDKATEVEKIANKADENAEGSQDKLLALCTLHNFCDI